MTQRIINWKINRKFIHKLVYAQGPKFSIGPYSENNGLYCQLSLSLDENYIKPPVLAVEFIELDGKSFDRNDTYECKIWVTLKKREYTTTHICYDNMYSLKKGLEIETEIPSIFFQETEILEFDSKRMVISCDLILKPNKLLCSLLVEERSGFEELLNNPIFSDFTLATRNKEFKVHKNILAIRSPVFCAMFSHNMIEIKENRVQIIEYNDEVIEELLRYMYTGMIHNLTNVMNELFDAARKYELDELKLICLTEMCRNMSSDNAIGLFTLVDSHDAQNLKEYSLDFITRNLNEIICTEEFKALDDHRLLKEIICNTAKNCS